MEPFLLVQLSDLHIGAEWGDGDPLARLARVIDAVRAMRPQPDALLLSGDLSDHASIAEYEEINKLLSRIDAPTYPLAGNHDDDETLRRHFGGPGAKGEALRYSVDVGPLRLVVVDSARRGHDPGALGSDRLAWLDAELAAAPDLPTLVALHHPPFATGVRPWDEVGLPPADRRALADVVARHAQVRALMSGHFHRTISGQVAGRPAFVAPSTYVQARLAFDGGKIELSDDPPGFAVHVLVDGDVVSHVQTVSAK